jgi:hypothetical protein
MPHALVVRGVHLKKLHRAEGGAKIFGVFRVKNQYMQIDVSIRLYEY